MNDDESCQYYQSQGYKSPSFLNYIISQYIQFMFPVYIKKHCKPIDQWRRNNEVIWRQLGLRYVKNKQTLSNTPDGFEVIREGA